MLNLIAAQRGYLFPWAPVAYGAGISLYFGLSEEPSLAGYGAAVIGVCLCILLIPVFGERLAPLLSAVALGLAGVLVAAAQAHLAEAPVLGFRYYGPVEGRIIAIDRSHSDKMRLTLDRVVLRDTRPDRTPERVRVSLHGQQGFFDPTPGTVVIMTAHLSPPQGPAEPGGFDFRRKAWFDRLGAVGYTRNPVLRLEPAEPGVTLIIAKLRQRISNAVRARIEGEAGAFAAAIMTGDRSAISRDTLAALRGANLAHLLAISGLHMGLLAGFVFATLRYGLALIPALALRWPIKKLAAGVALTTGALYLALSGGNVATMRAFVMVSVMLVAVMLDRRALTLHAVAVAALIVLTLEPQSLPGPGFQMSFAATTALVAVFGVLRGLEVWQLPRTLRPVAAVFVSSAIAGVATAPFAAAHFNQITHFGLIANLLSVPVMGAVVMPAAVVASLLSLVGLGWVGFWVMKQGILWILFIANTVSGMEGALSHVVTPDPEILPLIALGALLLTLWRGRGRLLGIPVVVAGLLLWPMSERPALLISGTGGLVGVKGEEGRALSRPRGDGFVAGIWLENDGAPIEQQTAHARPGWQVEDGVPVTWIGAQAIRHLKGKRQIAMLEEHCAKGGWIVVAGRGESTGPCRLIDIASLRDTGSIAINVGPDGELQVVTAAQIAGRRLWAGGSRRDQ